MTINALNIIPIKTDSCPTMDNKAAKLTRTVSWGNHKFGDIILYDFNRNGTADHTGIVVGKSGSVIYAVEGNTGSGSNTNGGQVQLRTRQKKTVKRFVRPKYTKDVTPAMVVYTALGQVGVKESPKNSNKVKYNQWFYGRNVSAHWCMTFVCWDFAHVETIPTVAKPTGKYSGSIPTGVRCGSKGNNVKQLQKFLNWYHPAWKLAVDGDFGPKTMRAIMVYQNTEGLTIDGDFGPKSLERANTYKAKKEATTTKPATTTKTPAVKPAAKKKQAYTGTFPTPNTNAKIINGLAIKMCWPYGTPQKKYTYKKGKPVAAYSKGIDKAYPKHKSWPNKKQRVGACCDILTGTVLGLVGIHVPKDLKNQLKQMPKMTNQLKSNGHYKAADFKAGDIVQRGRKDYSGHTFVIVIKYSIDKKTGKVKGTKYIANAHYKKLGGTYAVMDSKAVTQKPSKWKFYKCYTPLGAARTYYQKGDYGLDVYRIQRFLKWAGYYKGALGFTYNDATVKAVTAFQKAEKIGSKPDGKVGRKTIAKMKAYRK